MYVVTHCEVLRPLHCDAGTIPVYRHACYYVFLICAVLSQYAHYGWLKRDNARFIHILTDLQPIMLDCNL